MEELDLTLKSFYLNKKVLVTGHTGFKGSWLTQVLIMLGADVVGYSIDIPTEPSLYRILGLENKMTSVFGDICDFDRLKNVVTEHEPEIVFHLAAQPLVRLSYIEPLKTYSTNVMGTVNLLEVIRRTTSVRSFINITTDKVYRNIEKDVAYKESDVLDGFDPYSNSKSCSELITGSYRRSFFKNSDVSISTARAGNVIGGGDFALDRIVPDCFRSVQNNESLQIRYPDSVRPYQHVLEPLSAYLEIAMRQFNNQEFASSYNVGPQDDECLKTIQIVTEFQKCLNQHSSYNLMFETNIVRDFHEAGLLKLNSAYLHQKLGWVSRWSIWKGIEETVAWFIVYLNNGDLNEMTEKQIVEYFNLGEKYE